MFFTQSRSHEFTEARLQRGALAGEACGQFVPRDGASLLQHGSLVFQRRRVPFIHAAMRETSARFPSQHAAARAKIVAQLKSGQSAVQIMPGNKIHPVAIKPTATPARLLPDLVKFLKHTLKVD